MNSCVCVRATVHLSKDEDDFTRIQTVQAQISNLKLRDQEVYGLHDKVDWTDGHWRNDSSLDERIADQFRSKVYVFSDSVLCLNGNVPMILKQQELGQTIE